MTSLRKYSIYTHTVLIHNTHTCWCNVDKKRMHTSGKSLDNPENTESRKPIHQQKCSTSMIPKDSWLQDLFHLEPPTHVWWHQLLQQQERREQIWQSTPSLNQHHPWVNNDQHHFSTQKQRKVAVKYYIQTATPRVIILIRPLQSQYLSSHHLYTSWL